MRIEKTLSGLFVFDPDDMIYNDHFPGKPIVPGSLIIHSFIKESEKIGLNPGLIKIKSFKFKYFIVPGEYMYSIRLIDNKIICKLFNNENKEMVKGIFLYET